MDAQTELRAIKNRIIGNPEAKEALGNDDSLTSVVQCLDVAYDSPTRIEAANILYSISSGSQDAISSLLRHRAHAALLVAITSLAPSTPHRLKLALGRALRTLMNTLSDLSGPQQRGILPSVPIQLRKEAQFALEELFQPTSLDGWLPLLQDSTFYPFIAATISTSVRTPAHRTLVCEWLPPTERAKASKGKRGWEKPTTPLSPSNTSFASTSLIHGSAIHQLLTMALDDTVSSATIAVSLEALAALCQDSPSTCASLRSDLSSLATTSSSSGDAASHLQPLLQRLRTPSPEIRIASAQLLAVVIKASFAHPAAPNINPGMPPGFHRTLSPSSPWSSAASVHDSPPNPYLSTCLSLLHLLLGIIRSEDESIPLRIKACFILSRLVTDDKLLSEAAVDCGALQVLFVALKRTFKCPSPNCDEPSAGPSMEAEAESEEETAEDLGLREAAFTTLATLGLTDPQFSRSIFDTDASLLTSSAAARASSSNSTTHRHRHPFLFHLLSKSIKSDNLGVRYSALQLVRALTRALAVLRTGLVDSDVPSRVVEVVSNAREDQSAVTGADIGADADTEMRDGIKEGLQVDSNEGRKEHRAVIIAALMALCNLVNDYAPFREGGTIRHLVRWTYSTDDAIRLNALWAIKNSLFNAKSKEIVAIMGAMGWDHYAELAEDSDRRIREQAIVVLQNITSTAHDIDFVVESLGSERLVTILQKALSSNDPNAIEQAIRAMNNIITGADSHRDLILSQKQFMNLLRAHLTHSLPTVRRATVECVCELLDRRPFRHRELREAGIDQALRAVVGGRERTTSTAYSGIPSGSSFGAALANAGSFGPSTAGSVNAGASGVSPVGTGLNHHIRNRSSSDALVVLDSPGLMGRENDRAVLTAVKFALLLFERGKE